MDKLKKLYKQHSGKFILTAVLLIFTIFISTNSWMYKTPVAKVVKASIEKEETLTNYGNSKYPVTEKQFEQKVTLKLLNTEHKGKKITIRNTYTTSQMDNSKLSRGDKVFVHLNEGGKKLTGSVDGIKRDSHVFVLIALFIVLILMITKKRGILITLTLIINIALFAGALALYSKGTDILLLASVLVFVFPVITLIFSNGINKNTFAAIISSFISLGIAYIIFQSSIKIGGEIDYSVLDYIVGNQELDRIFFAGISLAGLGVIMDVSVTICSSLHELTIKSPDTSLKQLISSGKEIGYDIMGTMINVLLFTYICGLMPLIILKMKNGYTLLSIIKLQMPFEIISFLMGSIEILITIPSAILVSSSLFRKSKGGSK